MIEDLDLISIQEARNFVRKAKDAQKIISNFDDNQIDKILNNMVRVAKENAEKLAKMAVEETGFGKVEDKITKNLFASSDLYSYIKGMKTTGIIREDEKNKIIEIAEPVGLLLGIVPSTNPTSTTIYKCIIAIKSRNGIVFSPHPSALNCTKEAALLMNEAAVKSGAPDGIIQCISKPSMAATNELMKMPEINMIIATGGSGMVKAAYSSGKPALGVGPGNAPAFIERSADIRKAVKNIIQSKSFDNSTICASEQSIITEECIKDKVVEELKAEGAYFMTEEETRIVGKALFKPGFAMNPQFVGRSAEVIASKLGIAVPKGTKVLIGEQKGVGKDYPLSFEKLTTVLAFYTVNDWMEACDLCIKLLNNGGIGHTLSLHTEKKDIVLKFATKPVFRILVNCPSSLGGTGVVTGLPPSFTLGCGTWGGSSTSDNVTPMHLINIKRIAYPLREYKSNKPDVKDEGRNFIKKDDEIDLVVKRVMKMLKESGELIGS